MKYWPAFVGFGAGLLLIGCGGLATISNGNTGGTGGTQCSNSFLLPNYAAENDPNTGTQNLLLEWDTYPVRYFIQDEDVRTFGSNTINSTDIFQQSLNRWVIASNSQGFYTQVATADAADIILKLTPLASQPTGGQTLARTSILYYPSTGIITEATIEIYTWPQMTEQQFEDGLRGTMTHEIGHAIFLSGHSPHAADAMYPEGDATSDMPLSLRDKNTFLTSYCGVFQTRSGGGRSVPGEVPVLRMIECPAVK